MAICSSLWIFCRGRTGRESMAGKAARPRSHPCAAGGNTGAVQTHTPCAARAHRNTGPAAVSGKQTPGARAQHKANPISSRASTKARWVQGGRRAGGGEAPPGGTLALALAPSRAPIDASGGPANGAHETIGGASAARTQAPCACAGPNCRARFEQQSVFPIRETGIWCAARVTVLLAGTTGPCPWLEPAGLAGCAGRRLRGKMLRLPAREGTCRCGLKIGAAKHDRLPPEAWPGATIGC